VVRTTDSLDYVPRIRHAMTRVCNKQTLIVIDDNKPVLDTSKQSSIIHLLGEGNGTTIPQSDTVNLRLDKGGKQTIIKVRSDVSLWVQRMSEAKKKKQ
jgi:hypothetical protein